MSVSLTQVLSEIGVAVEKANIAIEQFAVDVKLKFIPGESNDGEMMVNVDSIGNYAPELTSEISLHYKSTLPSEGKARIEEKHTQVL